MKKNIAWLLSAIVSVVVLHFSAELLYGFYFANKMPYKYDPQLGWVPKANFNLTKSTHDSLGNEYEIQYSTNKYGFRAWGDLNTNKHKILCIGDSFTGDPNMSDVDSYFWQAGELTDSEVFAYGASGYGTLQELMVLKKYAKMIDPDLFVLQFCGNDFENNSMSWERNSIVRNQKYLRPYFDGKNVVYRKDYNNLYRFLYANSVIFRFSDIVLQNLQYKIYKGYYYDSRQHKDTLKNEISESSRITEPLFKMMANSLPRHTKLATFSCGAEYPEVTKAWIDIARKTGFVPYPDVSLQVDKAEQQGIPVRAADGSHWSPAGHRIVGRVLAQKINKLINDNSITD